MSSIDFSMLFSNSLSEQRCSARLAVVKTKKSRLTFSLIDSIVNEDENALHRSFSLLCVFFFWIDNNWCDSLFNRRALFRKKERALDS
jgi:hypothetical protein